METRLTDLTATLTASISAQVFQIDQICFVLCKLWSLNVFIGPESDHCLPLSDLHVVTWQQFGNGSISKLVNNFRIIRTLL